MSGKCKHIIPRPKTFDFKDIRHKDPLEDNGKAHSNCTFFIHPFTNDFANCIVEHTKGNLKMDKPHTRTNKIYDENVMPSFLPDDGSIGFNEPTAASLNISFTTNTSYSVWFMDRNFAFSTLNPSISPRAALDINQPGVVIFIYLKVREKLALINGQLIKISVRGRED